ncbi:MAG: hypothetical protein KJO33_00220 [Gammaproteobacteria bacterium]|nr:hypothetical protein [Gammaproteobacteria bacterium]
MNRYTLMASIWLVSGPLPATFELKDPAAEAMAGLEAGEVLEDSEAAAGGARACSEFSRNRKKQNDAYFSDLTWLISAIGGAGSSSFDPDAMTRWVADYCASHPERRLEEAAAAFRVKS